MSQTVDEVVATLEEFRLLEPNWNGYGGLPLPSVVLDKAIALVRDMKPCPSVFPSGRGSVQLEWEQGGLYVEMEIFEDRTELFSTFTDKEGCVTTLGDK